MITPEQFEKALTVLLPSPHLRLIHLADRLQISERSLYSFVQLHYQTTPAKLILQRRMDKALDLLRQQYYRTISEVAFAVGYSSPAHFSRHFTQYFGYPPSKVDIQ